MTTHTVPPPAYYTAMAESSAASAEASDAYSRACRAESEAARIMGENDRAILYAGMAENYAMYAAASRENAEAYRKMAAAG